jgi:hypothetical protein
MHTNHTLGMLDEITVCLGAKFHAFHNKTCSAFNTQELDCEMEAHQCHQQACAQTADKAPQHFATSNVAGQAHVQTMDN